MTRTQRVLDVNRVRALGVLTTSGLDLTSTLDLQLGGRQTVLDVDGIQTLAVGASGVDLLVDNAELGGVLTENR